MTEATLEYVVERLGVSPGRRLIAFREVGLPFWNVPVKCRVQENKGLDALSEFILRSVDSGLKSSLEISVFLGVSLELVEDRMAELVSHNNLVPVLRREGPGISYALTQKGQVVCRDLVEIQPRTVVIDFCFDGLTHKYELVDFSDRWRPQDLKREGILEIPAFPSDPPEVGPSATESLDKAFRLTKASDGAQLMTALGVEGRRTKFFKRAVALIFQSNDHPEEYSVHFAVDGRRSEPHEKAFDEAEGLRKLGIMDSLRSDSNPALEVLSPTVLAQASEDSGSEALRRATTTLRERTAQLEAASEDPQGAQRASIEEQLAAATGQLIQAQEALENIPVRTLEVAEHPEFLERALTETKERLLIVSPWIRSAVVNPTFVGKLKDLLENDVSVQIGYGIGPESKDTPADKDGIRVLADLEKTHPKLDLVRLGNTHAKILASDTKFVVVTSFNWLSFKGDPLRPFRDERGTIVTLASEIEKIFSDYGNRITQAGQARPKVH